MTRAGNDTYQWIGTGMFGDRKIRACQDPEALFFVYLIQSDRNNPAGIFHATPEHLAAESYGRWSASEVRKFLAALQRPEKRLIVYDDAIEELWIISLFKWKPVNPRVYAGARRVLNRIRSRMIYDAWWAKYRDYPNVRDWVGATVFTGLEATTTPAPEIEPEPAPPPRINEEVQTVWDYYVSRVGAKGMSLTDSRRTKILARFRDKLKDPETGEIRGVQVTDLFRAIDAVATSDFHMGRHPKTKGNPPNLLEKHIFANQDQLEKWLRAAFGGAPPEDGPEAPPAVPTTPPATSPPTGAVGAIEYDLATMRPAR